MEIDLRDLLVVNSFLIILFFFNVNLYDDSFESVVIDFSASINFYLKFEMIRCLLMKSI